MCIVAGFANAIYPGTRNAFGRNGMIWGKITNRDPCLRSDRTEPLRGKTDEKTDAKGGVCTTAEFGPGSRVKWAAKCSEDGAMYSG